MEKIFFMLKIIILLTLSINSQKANNYSVTKSSQENNYKPKIVKFSSGGYAVFWIYQTNYCYYQRFNKDLTMVLAKSKIDENDQCSDVNVFMLTSGNLIVTYIALNTICYKAHLIRKNDDDSFTILKSQYLYPENTSYCPHNNHGKYVVPNVLVGCPIKDDKFLLGFHGVGTSSDKLYIKIYNSNFELVNEKTIFVETNNYEDPIMGDCKVQSSGNIVISYQLKYDGKTQIYLKILSGINYTEINSTELLKTRTSLDTTKDYLSSRIAISSLNDDIYGLLSKRQ